MNTNANLQMARKKKNDEFYTTVGYVSEEVAHHAGYFRGKRVFCNCNDGLTSAFWIFFHENFSKLGLRKLVATTFNENGPAYMMEYSGGNDSETGECEKKLLEGNGGFASAECVDALKRCDIVCTNPPFSKFRDFFDTLQEHDAKYLIVSNMNAITYKNVLPPIVEGKVWAGYVFGQAWFKVPQDSEPRETCYRVDEDGQKWREMKNIAWFTNIEGDYHKAPELTQKYDPERYVKYDGQNAIEVGKIADIPYDYEGVMGVPITYIKYLKGSDFKLVGTADHGSDSKYDLFEPRINGKKTYKRLLIQRKAVGDAR